MPKKKTTLTPELRARFAHTMRLLEERIAHHAAKLAEEQRRAV
jgi:hypothetical protein